MRITIRVWFIFLFCLQTACFADERPPSPLDFYPKSDQYIRVTDHTAHWILIPIGPAKTRSIWQWHTDPGGRLPGWLIGLLVTKSWSQLRT